MRFYEVDSSVDAIMSAAMLAQTRASSSGKQGKLSMNGFLQMLANSGIMMDYDGFKTVYDTNPQLANVIAQFNKDSITFVGDSDDEDAEFEPTQGEMPDDERVAKMAKSAMKTREFVEATVTEDREVMVRATNIDYDGPALDKLPTDVNVKVMVNPGDSEDDIFDMVADELEDRYGVKVSGFDMNMMEGELPPHLSKMFGKDGSQVETRTDVMKQMRDIVSNKESKPVVFGDGKMRVDMYTASVLVQIYDKVNDANKEKIIQRIGTKEKFTKLMPKLFNMMSGAKVNEGKSMEDKIAADIEAGMSTDAIIGKYANKRTTNTDEIRKIIQKIKFKIFKNEGIRKGKPATGKDKIPDPAEMNLKKRIAKHVEDGLTRREVVAAYPNRDPNDIAKLYDKEKALQDFEADAKKMFPKAKDEPPTQKLSLATPITMKPLDLSKLDPNRVSLKGPYVDVKVNRKRSPNKG